MSNNQYFIKPDYVAASRAQTFESDGERYYWTQQRLRTSKAFQYHVYLRCQRHLIEHPGASLLEVGCGPAIKTAELLAPHTNKTVLVDQASLASLVHARLPDARFIAANLEQPDLSLEEHFDVVLCADVVEHLMDPDPCLQLIRQHLKPSGLGFVSTPERDILRGRNCTQSPHPAHVREWNHDEFVQYVCSHGLTIVAHELLPQAHLPAFEFAVSRWAQCIFKPPRWFGCQMVIVQP